MTPKLRTNLCEFSAAEGRCGKKGTYGMVCRSEGGHLMPVSCVFKEEKLHFIRNLGKR